VGQPCPPDLPAHAQADCLTFELAIDGERVVVDPGTSVYGSGPQRAWERSTRAHNTITVDGTDQTEVWGSFRAGRLAHATLHRAEEAGDDVVIEASHAGYAHLDGAPLHRRRWLVSPAAVDITDWVEGQGQHRVRLRVLFDARHLTVGAEGLVAGDGQVAGKGFRMEMRRAGVGSASGSGLGAFASGAEHSVGFGDRRNATELAVEGQFDLPATLVFRIALEP